MALPRLPPLWMSGYGFKLGSQIVVKRISFFFVNLPVGRDVPRSEFIVCAQETQSEMGVGVFRMSNDAELKVRPVSASAQEIGLRPIQKPSKLTEKILFHQTGCGWRGSQCCCGVSRPVQSWTRNWAASTRSSCPAPPTQFSAGLSTTDADSAKTDTQNFRMVCFAPAKIKSLCAELWLRFIATCGRSKKNRAQLSN